MIVVVFGPPGTGKTTVARRLQSYLSARGRAFRLLDSDEFGHDTYDRMYDRVADSGEHWIVAGTFYKRRFQEQFASLEDVVFVYLDADLETCLERNRRRPESIEEKAVQIIWHEFHEPDAEVTVDVNDRSVEAVVDDVVAALAALRADWPSAGNEDAAESADE
jgi:adenylylsulfate kinase